MKEIVISIDEIIAEESEGIKNYTAHLPTGSMRADVTNVQQSVKIWHIEVAIIQDLVHSYLRICRDQHINAIILMSPDSHLKIGLLINDAWHLPDNKMTQASADVASSAAFSSDKDAVLPPALIRSSLAPRC